MKKLFIPLITALFATHSLMAQEKTIPVTGAEALPDPPRSEERLELMPSQSPRLPAELPPIPDVPAKEPKKKGLPPVDREEKPEKKSKTEIAADEMLMRVRFRQAKTKAVRDPAVQEAWDRAHVAKTDFEKREVLKTYYTLLFNRMEKTDSRLKAKVDLEKSRALHRLEQNHINPTEPFEGLESN